jgi:hypothetical protein
MQWNSVEVHIGDSVRSTHDLLVRATSLMTEVLTEELVHGVRPVGGAGHLRHGHSWAGGNGGAAASTRVSKVKVAHLAVSLREVTPVIRFGD